MCHGIWNGERLMPHVQRCVPESQARRHTVSWQSGEGAEAGSWQCCSQLLPVTSWRDAGVFGSHRWARPHCRRHVCRLHLLHRLRHLHPSSRRWRHSGPESVRTRPFTHVAVLPADITHACGVDRSETRRGVWSVLMYTWGWRSGPALTLPLHYPHTTLPPLSPLYITCCSPLLTNSREYTRIYRAKNHKTLGT